MAMETDSKAVSGSPESASTLPPAQTFDFLPNLQAILTRLTDPTDPRALAPKDLPNEIGLLKLKIQGARNSLENVPDIQRTLVEQEEELKRWERRIATQREALQKAAAQAKTEI